MSPEGLTCMDGGSSYIHKKTQESFVIAKSFSSISSDCDFLGYRGKELGPTECMLIIIKKKHRGWFQSQTSAI